MNKTNEEVVARLREAHEVIGDEMISKLHEAGFMIMDADDVYHLWKQHKALLMAKHDLSQAMLDVYTMQINQSDHIPQKSAAVAGAE